MFSSNSIIMYPPALGKYIITEGRESSLFFPALISSSGILVDILFADFVLHYKPYQIPYVTEADQTEDMYSSSEIPRDVIGMIRRYTLEILRGR